jgi:hypothetical protein
LTRLEEGGLEGKRDDDKHATDVVTKSSSWARDNLAEGFPMTLFLTRLRVETLTV